MLENLIVLGQIPGTDLRLGFIPIMIMFEIGFSYYLIKKFHPKLLLKLQKKLGIYQHLKKTHKFRIKLQKKAYRKLKAQTKKLRKKTTPYEKRMQKKLVHLWHNILSPKLKFLK